MVQYVTCRTAAQTWHPSVRGSSRSRGTNHQRSKASLPDQATARLVEQQAQRALRLPAELAQAVGALARKEGDRLWGTRRAGARQRARRKGLARARLAVE